MSVKTEPVLTDEEIITVWGDSIRECQRRHAEPETEMVFARRIEAMVLERVQNSNLLGLAAEVFSDAKPSTPGERAALKRAIERLGKPPVTGYETAVGWFDSDCRCSCHDALRWCTGCYERHEGAKDGMGGGSLNARGASRERHHGEGADSQPARRPSDPVAQTVDEIARLEKQIRGNAYLLGVGELDGLHGCNAIQDDACRLASLARRLAKGHRT